MNHYIFDLDDTVLVHRNDINYTLIRENPELSHYLDKCKGDRYIYTNGNFSHANEVLERMNLTEKFKKVYSRDTLPEMKPSFHAGFMVQQDILKDRFESGANVYEVQKDKFVFFDDISAGLTLSVSALTTTGPLFVNSGYDILLIEMDNVFKAMLGLAMILGRLEILVIIALISPSVWNK